MPWHTSSIVSLMALGLPGRLSMRDFPRNPAVCLDKTAVGTCLHHATRALTQKVQPSIGCKSDDIVLNCARVAELVLIEAVQQKRCSITGTWGSLQAYGAHLLPVARHHAFAHLHACPRQSCSSQRARVLLVLTKQGVLIPCCIISPVYFFLCSQSV